MRKVSLAQTKGGVGKSAAAIHLACQAFGAGERVALLDLDVDQRTAARWGARRKGELAGDRFRVEVVGLVELSGVLASLEGEAFDWVFLDLPGRSDATTGAGITASDFVLMPCRPLDVDIEASIKVLSVLMRSRKPYAYLMNICPPQVNAARARQVAGVLIESGRNVCPHIIVQRIQVPDAIGLGKHAGLIDPDGLSDREFRKLFTWLEQQIGVEHDKGSQCGRSGAGAYAGGSGRAEGATRQKARDRA